MSLNWRHIPDETAQLFSELVDGSLREAEREELRQRLATEPELLAMYCAWMHLHAALSLDLKYALDLPPTAPLAGRPRPNLSPPAARPSSDPQRKPPRRLGYLLTTAAGLLIAVGWSLGKWLPEATLPVARQQPLAATSARVAGSFDQISGDSVAVIAGIVDATLADGAALILGAPLTEGRFELRSGLVQLEFLSGANVVVEGPAVLDLNSPRLVVCRQGKLRARVPQQAKGFSVDTPNFRAVDLGTEFGVSVTTNETEIHVFEGEVELQPLAKDAALGPLQTLQHGAGVRASASGEFENVRAESDQFADIPRLIELSSQQRHSRYATWQETRRRWQADPNVIAYFNFEDHPNSARILRQDGPVQDGSRSGAIVGCRWAEGRWPGKAALEFKGIEDRVLLGIPGEFQSITLASWIRIDGFDRRSSSILLTDGHDVGEPHWQFTAGGQLLLGVKADPLQSQEYLTEMVLKPTDLGRWLHLACVYDDERRVVSHYIDGERVYSSAITKRVPIRFGVTQLGNWTPESLVNDRLRNLNGRIDEFLLIQRALSEQELQSALRRGPSDFLKHPESEKTCSR